MAKKIPEKCKRCAMMSAAQAQELHGEMGDRCWNSAVCYSRRSYARHHDRRKILRAQQRVAAIPELVVSAAEFNSTLWAVLVIYRPVGKDTPIHAIAAQVWEGQERFATIKPVHTAGMSVDQVHLYVQKMLDLLGTKYGIHKFASLERLDPFLCPLRPCPCFPEI